MSDTKEMDETNGKTGTPEHETHADLKDETKKYIIYDDSGWLIARIHISQGFYPILGFLREIEDSLRTYFIRAQKEQTQKKIIQPGWRGFNPFKRG